MLALLSLRQFYAADLWTITLIGGTVLRYTSGDKDIVANGNTYSAGGLTGPYFDRTDNRAKCHWNLGTSVDNVSVDIIPGSATVLGLPWLKAAFQGVFDGATAVLERAFMPTYGDTRVGTIYYFGGTIADMVTGRSLITMNVNAKMDLLNLQFPRNIAQAGCMNNLGDATCQVVINSFKTTGTCTGTPTNNSIPGTLAGSFAADTFTYGTVTFTSGLLNGYSAAVKQDNASGGTSVTLKLQGFLPVAPTAGDTFTLYYGCNKSYTNGNGCHKFSNTAKFRGFPFTPQPAVAV